MASVDCSQAQINFENAKHCVVKGIKLFITTNTDVLNIIGDFNNINKIVQDGQITTTYSPNTSNNIVLYEQDPQLFNTEFQNKINTIVNCFENPENTYNTIISSAEPSWYSATTLTETPGVEPFLDFSNLTCSAANINSDSLPNIDLIEAFIALPTSYSQSVPIDNSFESINEQTATQLLDTNIYELLSAQESNIERILAFFQEYNALKGSYPSFVDIDGDGQGDDFSSNAEADTYRSSHDINANTFPEGFIPRLNADVSLTGYTDLQDDVFPKTLQGLRNDLDLFLRDIDFESVSADTRPIYQDRSSGYLKIRNLNQAIIIRNEESNNIGLENWETDGFTITMWVKFLIFK